MRIVIIFIFMLFLFACSSVNSVTPFDHEQADKLIKQHDKHIPAKERVQITLPRAFKQIKENSQYFFIPRNESLNNWHEQLQTSTIAYQPYAIPAKESIMREKIELLKTHCKVDYQVIEKTSRTLIYEATMCCHDKQEQMLVKLFQGVDAVYIISYRAHDVSEKEFKQMRLAIKRSSLVFNPKHSQKIDKNTSFFSFLWS